MNSADTVFGMSLATYTFVHVMISLAGIGSGLVALFGLLAGRWLERWTAVFLATTVATSVTGYGFPFERLLPSHVVGGISLVVLAVAVAARYAFHLRGAWRRVYVVSAVLALYLNVFVGVVQLFLRVPALKALAPRQTEAPFVVAQGIVLLTFVALTILAAVRFRGLALGLVAVLAAPVHVALAQTTTTGTPMRSSVLSTGGGAGLLDTADSVILLLDHQSGLFQTVKDISVAELRSNTIMLAKLATLLKIPVITTASEPSGPNGPLMPEIHQFAPHAVFVPRKGEVNAWDNEDFVKTVRATGRKTLIMAGVWTSVCVAFPALDARKAGFSVYAVIDASGDPSEMASRVTVARLAQAGVVPTSTNAVLSETHRTWNRPEAAELAKLYALVAPNYAAVIESYQKAQDVVRGSAK